MLGGDTLIEEGAKSLKSMEAKIDTDKMVDFCKRFKAALNKEHIYKICRELSDDDLAKSIYLIFGDI